MVIIGGGPAGTLLSHLLDRSGIQTVLLEKRSRDHVLGRVRAGVIEQGSADILRRAGLAERMDGEGLRHSAVNLAFRDRLIRIDFEELVGSSIMIYGQTELQRDLYDARESTAGAHMVFEVVNVELDGLTAAEASVSFDTAGERRTVRCDFVAGCDGSHGVAASYLPADNVRAYEHVYPFGWLGFLTDTPPVSDELIYCNHARGFALCSMRHLTRSRYYLQCPLDANLEDWPDDRFWEELSRRLPSEVASTLATGPSIEKSITPLASTVREPMQHGRLFLAGDAAHLVPPTGAKGLNLAISDVVHLARALDAFYARGSEAGLAGYSATALNRVWQAVRFSWWLTTLMHRLPDDGDFGLRIQEAELEYLSASMAAQTAMAENYVGLPI